MLYKHIENGYIQGVFKSDLVFNGDSFVSITETEYNQILETVENKPEDTLEYIYRLSAGTNQYVSFERTLDETVEWYFQKVTNGEMTIEEVPEDYKTEVEAKLPKPEPEKYTLDEAAALLTQEVANEL